MIQPFLKQPFRSGTQEVFRFDNGFGASVVCHEFSYGGRQGLFELGVIQFAGDDWTLTYATDVTDDVLGYLTPEEVETALLEIQSLTPDGKLPGKEAEQEVVTIYHASLCNPRGSAEHLGHFQSLESAKAAIWKAMEINLAAEDLPASLEDPAPDIGLDGGEGLCWVNGYWEFYVEFIRVLP